MVKSTLTLGANIVKLILLSTLLFGSALFGETLDRTVITPIGAGGSTIRRMVRMGQGVVAAGDSSDGTRRVFALARYDEHGELNPNFGTNGIVTTTIGPLKDIAFAVVKTADKKIIAAGWSYQPGMTSKLALVRYTAAGAIDTTFGANGIVTYGIPTWTIGAYAMTLQDDGKILVAAQAINPAGAHYYFMVARFLPDGAIDGTFGTNGVSMSELFSSFPHGIAVAPNGKIVIAGHFLDGDAFHFVLQRYSRNGVLDTSFGTNGTVITAFGPGVHSVCEKIIIDDSNGIYAAGSVTTSPEVLALLHYQQNGTLDTKSLVTIGAGAHAFDLVKRGNRITVAGYGQPASRQEFALARFKMNGDLDTTFGTNGVYTVPVGTGDAHAEALVVDKAGRLVAGGSASPDGGPADFALIRVDGSAD